MGEEQMSAGNNQTLQIEQARLDLDAKRYADEQRLQELRLELDKIRIRAENRFVTRHLGTFVTGLVSLAAVIVSLSQVFIAQTSKQKEIEVAQILQKQQREVTDAQQTRDWNLKVFELVVTHQDVFFGPDDEKKKGIVRVAFAALPPQIASPLFDRLAATDKAFESAQTEAARALFVRIDSQNPAAWMSTGEYVQDFVKQRDRDLYPSKVEGRLRDGIEEFRAEWKPASGLMAWQSYHWMTKEDFEKKNDDFTNQGYSRESLTTFKDRSGAVRYLATWTRQIP